MKLTGKCLEAFEKWKSNLHKKWVKEEDETCLYYGYSQFKELPQSMQYGVYVDFFDSVEVFIEKRIILVGDGIGGSTNRCEYTIKDQYCDTRSETREQAIIKANEIYNNL